MLANVARARFGYDLVTEAVDVVVFGPHVHRGTVMEVRVAGLEVSKGPILHRRLGRPVEEALPERRPTLRADGNDREQRAKHARHLQIISPGGRVAWVG